LIYVFLSALLILAAATVTDVRYTVRGIAKGLGVEGNAVIRDMFGNKPSAFQLYTSNLLLSLPMIACGLLGAFAGLPNPEVYTGLGAGSMLAYAALHLKGAYDWAKLGA
jgi:hypothetical protein